MVSEQIVAGSSRGHIRLVQEFGFVRTLLGFLVLLLEEHLGRSLRRISGITSRRQEGLGIGIIDRLGQALHVEGVGQEGVDICR